MTDESEDEYVSYGTPLPEIEDEATLRKKAARQLQVRDEKGRQRFHGAFTGGFSAGYFNTVGTKEGWTPSTFTSSRTKNADRIQQNPEDFMDDEDLGEFGIATRKIHTSSNFQVDSSASTSKRKYTYSDSIIPGEAPLKDIVKPVSESIGIQILRKLGWRHGQGIGPRTKKQTAGPKVYGCSPFPDVTQTEEEDQIAMSFTFAPKDTDSLYFKPKDDYFGLGYSGLSKESILSAHIDLFAPTSTKSFLKKDKKKIAISGQAFGVGAFEDDDADIYSKDDMSQYDFSDLTLEGSKSSQKDKEPKKSREASAVIEGFCSATQPPTDRKYFPPPTLPPNYKPIYLKTVSSGVQIMNREKSRHSLTATDRSIILGENKFQKSSTNVTSVAAIAKAATNEAPCTVKPITTSSLHFHPFPNDSAKQQRYEEYLTLKDKGDIGKLVQPLSMTEWEKQQEVEEFAKASVLFKPLSNVLSSRFESRSHLSVEHEVMAALEKIKKEKESKPSSMKRKLVGTSNRKIFEWHPVSLLCKRMNVPNPYPNSADSNAQTVLKSKSVFEHLSFTQEKPKVSVEPTSPVITPTDSVENVLKDTHNKSSDVQSSNIPIPLANAALPSENKKPPIDLFKAIFGNSSDEDSEDEKEEESNKDTNTDNVINNNLHKDSIVTFDQNPAGPGKDKVTCEKDCNEQIKPRNSSSNKNVGFGVFANLDLDALNQRKPVKKLEHQDTYLKDEDLKCDDNLTTHNSQNESVKEEPRTDDMYGPALPPNFSGSVSHSLDNSNTFSKNLESIKYEKHKSKHKHKSHKHKSKKKKKKSSKKYSSSESESSDCEDVSPALIIEKLKKLQKLKYH